MPEGDRTDAVGNEEVELVQRKFRKIEILVSEKKTVLFWFRKKFEVQTMATTLKSAADEVDDDRVEDVVLPVVHKRVRSRSK